MQAFCSQIKKSQLHFVQSQLRPYVPIRIRIYILNLKHIRILILIRIPTLMLQASEEK